MAIKDFNTVPTPLNSYSGTVQKEWIDDNNHMNVAYYVLAFDFATDALFNFVGLSSDYKLKNKVSTFAVDMNVSYKRELRLGEAFCIETRLIDCSNKALHYFHEMYHAEESFLAATNFSIGVTLLSGLVSKSTKMLGAEWDIEILEMHHKHKIDAPSGTALLLGKSAAHARNQKLSSVKSVSRNGTVGKRKESEIGFAVLRGGDVVGEHSVIFSNSGERIELVHKATDRSIFASGALRASYWAATADPGLYSLSDVLINGG